MTISGAATVSLYIVLVFVVIFALLTVALLAIIAFSLRALQAKVDEALTRVEPVLDKTVQTLDSVQRVTSNIGERADAILGRGEELTDGIARKVETTASVVQKAVSTPLINASSLIAGVTEGLLSLTRQFGKSRNHTTEDKGNASNGRH
jgi:uncharacterized protein YoxC